VRAIERIRTENPEDLAARHWSGGHRPAVQRALVDAGIEVQARGPRLTDERDRVRARRWTRSCLQASFNGFAGRPVHVKQGVTSVFFNQRREKEKISWPSNDPTLETV
jgi:hypothetical protein